MPNLEPAPGRGFSLATAVFVIVSSMVGGGILTTSGYVALKVGSHEQMLLVWIVAGAIAACGALTLAELSASLPRSGGEFVILSEAYGPLVGFLGGWISLVMGFIAPIAATASAASSYLLAPCGETSSIAVRLVGTAAIVAFAVTHAMGRSRTVWVQGFVTTATLAALAAFIVAGISRGWPHREMLLDSAAITRKQIPALLSSLIFVSYSYTGWNAASYMVGEMAEPQKKLPAAVILGTSLVLLLYLGLNLVYAIAVPIGDLRHLVAEARGDPDAVKQIADIAAQKLFGPKSAAAISIGFGLVILASLSALMATGPRVAFAMSRERRLPAIFGKVSTQGHAPWVAILTVAAASIAVLWSGRFEQILLATGLGLALTSLLTIAAVYVLRIRRPGLSRPFRVPGYPVVPAIYLAFTAVALAFCFIDADQRMASLAGVAAIASGLPVYWLVAQK